MADVISSLPVEKEYDDWQQSLPVATTLMERLSKPGSVVVDPQIGTGTNAVAAALLANRTFIGGDIDPEKIKIARHRVATEGTGGIGDESEFIRQLKEAGVFDKWNKWILEFDGCTDTLTAARIALENGWDAESAINSFRRTQEKSG